MSFSPPDKLIEMYACSDIGRVRRNNEDRVSANAQRGYALLADGMGGHNAGEVASAMAITTLTAVLQGAGDAFVAHHPTTADPGLMQKLLSEAIACANSAIHTASRRQPEYAGMGTTLVALQLLAGRFVLAHVGDSRCYHLRAQEMKQLTRDHSVVQQRIDLGLISDSQARGVPGRHMLTRALGTAAGVAPDFTTGETQPGDIFLLCSDGLSDMVEAAEIAHVIAETSASVEVRAERLIQLANQNGGRDNVSVVLVAIPERHAMNRRQGG